MLIFTWKFSLRKKSDDQSVVITPKCGQIVRPIIWEKVRRERGILQQAFPLIASLIGVQTQAL